MKQEVNEDGLPAITGRPSLLPYWLIYTQSLSLLPCCVMVVLFFNSGARTAYTPKPFWQITPPLVPRRSLKGGGYSPSPPGCLKKKRPSECQERLFFVLISFFFFLLATMGRFSRNRPPTKKPVPCKWKALYTCVKGKNKRGRGFSPTLTFWRHSAGKEPQALRNLQLTDALPY